MEGNKWFLSISIWWSYFNGILLWWMKWIIIFIFMFFFGYVDGWFKFQKYSAYKLIIYNNTHTVKLSYHLSINWQTSIKISRKKKRIKSLKIPKKINKNKYTSIIIISNSNSKISSLLYSSILVVDFIWYHLKNIRIFLYIHTSIWYLTLACNI